MESAVPCRHIACVAPSMHRWACLWVVSPLALGCVETHVTVGVHDLASVQVDPLPPGATIEHERDRVVLRWTREWVDGSPYSTTPYYVDPPTSESMRLVLVDEDGQFRDRGKQYRFFGEASPIDLPRGRVTVPYSICLRAGARGKRLCRASASFDLVAPLAEVSDARRVTRCDPALGQLGIGAGIWSTVTAAIFWGVGTVEDHTAMYSVAGALTGAAVAAVVGGVLCLTAAPKTEVLYPR